MGAEKAAPSVGRIEALSVPGWAELPWLVHGFSTRAGGRTTVYGSEGPGLDGELNLGFTAHDTRENVLANRERWIAHLLAGDAEARVATLVTLRQTHSSLVHRVSRAPEDGPATLEGDGLITDVPGVMLGILTADCVPVIVVDRRRRAVAAFHAGWRGTLQQIVEGGIARMQEEFGSAPEDLLAAVGPAIGLCCYSVGEEVQAQFSSRFWYADELFSGKRAIVSAAHSADHSSAIIRLNLAEANRRQLLAAGLKDAAITLLSPCTSCNTDRFFSHRAESGVTGRMMALVGLLES